MAFWSRLRSLLGLGPRLPTQPSAAADAESEAHSTAASAGPLGKSAADFQATSSGPLGESAADSPAASSGSLNEGVADSPAASTRRRAKSAAGPDGPGEPAAPHDESAEEEPAVGLAGVIDDWTAATATGLITLTDGAALLFGREACQNFSPLIGLRIEVLAIGLPPPAPGTAPAATGPALWATQVRLLPGSETEYAARLRISQVERAVRGQVDRLINAPPDGQPTPASAPPWARNKAGKKPAGPARPADAFFTLTVVLGKELTDQPQALAALLRSPVWPQPTVRIIQLARKGQPEAGFSAEITAGTQRAFLLYRPQPYAALDTPPQGVGHVGLFVGGPHGPRALTQLPPGVSSAPLPLSVGGEPRLLAALARSLLQGEPEALGLVCNRAGRAWKPREIALNQLGPLEPPEADAAAAVTGESPLPFLLFIDWNVGERGGTRCQKSCGMEALGLPDVAVFFTEENQQDRARDALWFACHELAAGRLQPGEQTLNVPRRLQLRPGSRLLLDTSEQTLYKVSARDEQWLELVEASLSATSTPPSHR